MTLDSPDFWYRCGKKHHPAEAVLSPLSQLYLAGAKLKRRTVQTRKADVPVICIGNITAGGSGKTPAAIAIANILRESGRYKKPFFLSRGYGGKKRPAPVLVDPSIHGAKDVGDEPLLLCAHAPVVVCPNRYKAARFAENAGADILIMDDGMQNETLHKDLTFMVIDGQRGFGNGKVIPAGPLRETLASGLNKADAFILNGKDKTGALYLLPGGKPIFSVEIATQEDASFDTARKYIAFCGIGHPDRFYESLSGLGLNVIAHKSFPDHHAYRQKEIERLAGLARDSDAKLITTEKDYMRLRHFEAARNILTLPVRMRFESEEAIISFLSNNPGV